jgi:nucleoside-diphosphate-sugar epimerase
MRTLIVGGAGYLGGAVVDELQSHTMAHGSAIHVYDNLLYERQYMKDVTFHHGDVRDRHRLLRLIEGENYDVIIWLAAIVGDPACSLNPELARAINQDAVE